MLEPGVDAGGLLKEFLTEITNLILDPKLEYFKLIEDQTLFFNKVFNYDMSRLKFYFFLKLFIIACIFLLVKFWQKPFTNKF